MRVLSVVGARPQFVKLAPLAQATTLSGIDHVVIHTGQHYDRNMSRGFFDELGIPAPHVNLGIGSGSHGVQTGRMMAALDPIFEEYLPDWVLVYGDTNSTLAAAVCATKLHLPLAHLEAGLRSFNRRMPEEHNRVLTDHAADLCLAPTQGAVANLCAEGIGDRTQLVGDVMADVLLGVAARVRRTRVASPVIADETPYILATIHRADNTDNPERLLTIIEALAASDHLVYLPAHPRLRARCAEFGINLAAGSIQLTDPLGYPQLVQALLGAAGVVTDSGGLQKEAFLLGVPTSTVRSETEWVETLVGGWNVLVPDPRDLPDALSRSRPTCERGNPFGDGHAASRAVNALENWR